FEYAQVDRRMKTQSAFVGADGAVHLDTVTAVHMNLTVVIHPRHAEHDHTLRFDESLNDTRLEVFGMLLQERPQRAQNFFGCLMEFGLLWVAQLQVRQAGCQRISHGGLFFASLRRNGANLSEVSTV